MRRFLTAIAPVAMVVAAVPAAAHTNIDVEGTVVSLTADSILIRTREGITLAVMLTEGTQVTRGDKPATIKDVKIGQTVLIEGYGDTADDMLALGIVIKGAG